MWGIQWFLNNINKKTNPIEVIAPQNKIFDSFVNNLITTVSSGTKVGTLLAQLDSDKTDSGEDIFADMPSLEDALDHDRSLPRQNLSNTLFYHAKVLESPIAEDYPHSQVVTSVIDKVIASQSINVNHVLECSDTVVVPSLPRTSFPMNEQSLVAAKALLPNNSMLSLQNPF